MKLLRKKVGLFQSRKRAPHWSIMIPLEKKLPSCNNLTPREDYKDYVHTFSDICMWNVHIKFYFFRCLFLVLFFTFKKNLEWKGVCVAKKIHWLGRMKFDLNPVIWEVISCNLINNPHKFKINPIRICLERNEVMI